MQINKFISATSKDHFGKLLNAAGQVDLCRVNFDSNGLKWI